jgi:hypothetical protein
MQRKLGKLDLQPVVLLQFLDTPGDEVTPRSDKIGEYFQDQWLRHDFLLHRGSKYLLIGMFSPSETADALNTTAACARKSKTESAMGSSS